MIFNTIEFLDSANKPLPVPDRVRLSRAERRAPRPIRWARPRSDSPRPPNIVLAKPPPPAHCGPSLWGNVTISRKRQRGGLGALSVELLINAIIAGLLLGGFYAAVTVGVSISFGILDIVNIAHPAFIILGAYIAYIVNDPRGRPDPDRHHRAAGVLRARRGGLSGLLRVVRETRPGRVARTRVLLRAAVRHRGDADPGVRRRLSLRAGLLHRIHLALSASWICRSAWWSPA